MGGKTELTTIKTLMEITGQNKEDVQNVLQKFGGDEDLAVSELMNSACFRVNKFFFFFLVTTARGSNEISHRRVTNPKRAFTDQRLTLFLLSLSKKNSA